MPIDIQTAQHASIMRPNGSVQSSVDVSRAGEADQRHHDERQRADDGGGSLGFLRHRLDFCLHLLAVAQHARQIAERFRQVAAGALLNGYDDAEEVGLRDRHAFVELEAGFAERHADRLGLDDERNSLRTGSSASVAISLRLSSSGRPALMPRTMTLTASGK